MFGQTESNAFPGIDCFGRIYWFGDVLLIVSSHVETVVQLVRNVV